jgi:hypothetical protein
MVGHSLSSNGLRAYIGRKAAVAVKSGNAAENAGKAGQEEGAASA